MNKKLMLIAIVCCVGLQSNLSMGSEKPAAKKQTWGEWFSSWLTYGRPNERAMGHLKESLPRTTLALLAGGVVNTQYPEAVAIVGRVIQKKIRNIDSLLFGSLYINTIFTLYASFISQFLFYYKTGQLSKTDALLEIKNYLRITLGNQLLYPTRSSKVNVLTDKDEFLAYVDDQDGLLNEVCDQLLREIQTADYSEEQQQDDQKIDAHILELKVNIDHLLLEQQIDALKWIADRQNTVEKMRGYLSLYYRLQNKLEVENKRSLKQKTSGDMSKRADIARSNLAKEKELQAEEQFYQRANGKEEYKKAAEQKELDRLSSIQKR